MTPQEHQALQTLLSQLVQVGNIPKDPEAEPMIARAVAQQPDAAYLLVQRVMILEQALEAAKAQLSDLQQQAQAAPRPGRSFLDANAWGQSARSPENHQMESSRGGSSVSGTPLPPNPAQQQYSAPPYAAQPASSRFFGGGAGSMLGTMAATAAGVAGGAFLFNGLENLLGHHHGQNSQGLFGNNDQSQPLADASPSSLFSSSELDKLGPSGTENYDNSLAGQDDGTLSDDLFASDEPQDDLFASDDSSGDDSYDV